MPEEWLQAERQALLQEAIAQASLLGLRPGRSDVEGAERWATRTTPRREASQKQWPPETKENISTTLSLTPRKRS